MRVITVCLMIVFGAIVIDAMNWFVMVTYECRGR